MTLTHGGQMMLRNMCAIFGMPIAMTNADPPAALRLLILVYSMPLQRSQAERRTAANAILAATEGHFDKWSPFVLTLGRVLATMQELPFHFNNQGRSTQDLVDRYQALDSVSYWTKGLGLVAGAGGIGAANAGVAEAVKTGSARAAINKAGARIAGYAAVPEAVAQRLGTRVSPEQAKSGMLALVAAATISYYSAEKEKPEIRAILLHRFQSGKATDAQYRVVFRGGIEPNSVTRYWEVR